MANDITFLLKRLFEVALNWLLCAGLVEGVYMRDINKIPRAFKLYKKLSGIMKYYESIRPQGRSGIACENDEPAQKWQRLEFRTHVIECYITGEKINWFYARWLSNDEAKRRNILNT